VANVASKILYKFYFHVNLFQSNRIFVLLTFIKIGGNNRCCFPLILLLSLQRGLHFFKIQAKYTRDAFLKPKLYSKRKRGILIQRLSLQIIKMNIWCKNAIKVMLKLQNDLQLGIARPCSLLYTIHKTPITTITRDTFSPTHTSTHLHLVTK